MGKRIPDSIRSRAIKKWLEGESRDKIAEDLQKSQGAVSGMIKEAGKNDPPFPLLREVAVYIKAQGMDIESFAPLVRIRTVLRDKGILAGSTEQENSELIHNRLEAAIVSMEEFLFYKESSLEDFFSLVTNVYDLADEVGVRLNDFPSYIKKLKDKIDDLRKEISQEEKKRQDFQHDHDTTLELLQEYMANKPFLETLENHKKRAINAEKRICELEEELENERRSNELEKQDTWSDFEHSLEKAKEEILPGVEIPHFMNTLKDAFRHPQRYRKSINRMMDIYDGYQEVYPTQTNFSTEAN
jgi:chromosome segregation ATPase